MTKPNALDSVLRILPKKRVIPADPPPSYVLFPFEYHEKLKEPFEAKLEESKRLIRNHLTTFNRVYVATSHGKDSMIVCHLVWTVAVELHMENKVEFWLNDTFNTYKEEKAFWDVFNKWLGIEDKFRVFTPPKLPNGVQATVWSVADYVGHLPAFRRTSRKESMSYKYSNIPECCDWLKKRSVNNYLKSLPKDQRFDCHFVGTRGEESQNRSLGVLQRCRSYLITSRKPYPIRAVTPLSFWVVQDVYEYFTRFNLPKNPTYEIHNLKRMGCASCPAHIGWEVRLATDPTAEGLGMLTENLRRLKQSEPKRLKASLKELKDLIKSEESRKQITEERRTKIIEIIQKFDNTFVTLMDKIFQTYA